MKNKTYNKKKILVVFLCATIMIFGLIGRLIYLMVFDAEYYQELAEDLHEREREIKAARGEIVDRNGVVLATNRTVCTISVIHSQIEDPETVIRVLSDELKMDEADVRERVEKVSSMEKIKTNVEKDTELLPKVAEVLQGKNALVMSAREENYKAVGAAAGLAYNQKVGAESAVDINLAKQLNVVMTQLGVKAQDIVMNVGSAAVGYGFEYVVSTMDRIKGAALSQNDNMLQMPIITAVADEAWSVKEAMATEEDMPEWGPLEERGISMEVQTAAAVLASGSDAVILKHPQSVATISKMIKELM